MNNEKFQIEELIKLKPKHYVKMIKNDPILWDWVLTNSTTDHESPATKIYSAITSSSGRCPNGKLFKYHGPSKGWGGCGRASVCQCTRDSVSSNVAKNKANRSNDDIIKENKKRESTNKEKYGVTNIGKTQKAKDAHKNFYKNSEKVKKQISKQEQTMIAKYGVKNVAYLDIVNEKKKATNLERYGCENAMQNLDVAKRSAFSRRSQWDPSSLLKINYKKFVDKCEKDWNVRPLLKEEEYKGVYPLPLITFECLSCGCTEERKLDYGRIPICKVCNPPEVKFESSEEVAVREYIKTIYSGNLKIRDRSIINPYELDMILIDIGLAIEYCGLYWHSEVASGKKWSYHEHKMKIANAAGLRLITIFSDEWKTKQDIVKSKLNAIINTNQTFIGARECKVKNITRQQASEFHDNYHIQGSPVRLKNNIGLFFHNELIAVGSFNITDGEHVLSRYSSSHRVIGGCSKITKFYHNESGCDSIISFADLRWSEGEMYKSSGYIEESRVPPMQSYVGNKYSKRYDKRAFPRSKINPENRDVTEWQRMQELGYDRIWDCGKIKFRLNLKK